MKSKIKCPSIKDPVDINVATRQIDIFFTKTAIQLRVSFPVYDICQAILQYLLSLHYLLLVTISCPLK